MDAGASVNNLCNMCRKAPPIALALKYNCSDIFNLLIENGATLTNKGSGFDVIHVAAENSSLEILQDLVEIHALDVNQLAGNGMINAAFFAGSIKKLQYLINFSIMLFFCKFV